MPMALTLFSLALLRLSQARWVRRYQRHLVQQKPLVLALSTLPMQKDALFLGIGFRWQAKHTARLVEAEMAMNKEQLKNVNQTGGSPFLNGVSLKQSPIFMPNQDRVGHTLVLGTTRVGKTRLLEVMVAQDIRRGDAVIVFDPKGDLELLRRIVHEAKACGRESDVEVFHLGFPDQSARYNPIGEFARITEVANRLTAQLPGQGESAAFKEFAWRFVNIIAKAVVAMGLKPSYQLISRYILNMDQLLVDYCLDWLSTLGTEGNAILDSLRANAPIEKQAKYLIEQLNKAKLSNDIITGLQSSISYDKTYFHKITASLLPLLDKLTTGKVNALLSPDVNDGRSIFSWRQVIQAKKIVYVGLDALSDSTIATAVGNSMFADLCSTAGQIYKYGLDDNVTSVPVCIHSDEFNELIGDEFIPLINKAGGAGFQVTAYTQTWADIEARLGSHAKAGQVAGNFNQLICLL